jgi:aspartyl-tRNA(Asn)/glutamyl-tRNA(Gln) amidotransferase subunit C
MPLSLKEVEHIAALARLDLDAGEKDRFREQLSAILDYAARLQELDTADVPPTTGAPQAAGRPRPDEARPSLDPRRLLDNAPQEQDGQFKVPPVFE